MAKQAKTQVVVADTEAELDAATAAAARNTPKATPPDLNDPNVAREANPPGSGPPNITVGDYTPGQPLDVQNPLQATPESLKNLNEQRRDVYDRQRGGPQFPNANTTRYESRIRIAEAWQYNGQLASAPGWVDRSWAAWGDADSLRGLEQGPALRVPTVGQVTEKVARVGDYVVRQEVTIALGVEPDIQIEVWEKENFEKFFLPSHPEILKAGKDEDAAQQP